ncbi:PRX-12 protein [Aphelenchoides avenae]|nr:PRX-12 protein [Aphelenchus avenae]
MAAAAFRSALTGGSNVLPSALPSIFDILAQQSLTTSLKPALQHVVKFVTQSTRGNLLLANKFFDELYALLLLLLENHYLKRYGGSFSENFYGLKRVALNASSLSRIKSLFYLVMMPYIRDKLDAFSEKLRDIPPRQRKLWSQYFLRFYPHLKTVLAAVALAFQVAYAFSYTTVPSLSLLLVGVRLERLTPQDIQSFEAIPLHLQKTGIIARLWRFLVSIPSVLGRLLSYGLFVVQFLEYFYNDDMSNKLSLGPQRAPAPPHPYKVLSLDADKCPLCYRRRENDTALAVSGYVFCFKCINDYVRREGQCPVTFIPASHEQLIRLYRGRA